MKRIDFLKSLGVGVSGISLPKNIFFDLQEVMVYDNYIKGANHYQYKKVKSKIKEGDRLTLKREPENLYDGFAIEVFFENHKLGYITAYENIVLANMMDNQVELSCLVSKHNKKEDIFRCIAIRVYSKLVIPTEKFAELLNHSKRADDIDDLYRKGFP